MKTKGKVYLVDDDELILAMLSRALRQEGYDVETDATGQEVPGRLKSFFPDVALLDIKLPGKSGLEVFQEIRESGIPCQVVMLTSDDTAETAIKAMKLGAADYLTKPFDLEEVKIVIGQVIENGRLRREVQCLRMANPDLYQADFLGESPAAREIREKAAKLARARVRTVLITGESGTGKEVLARYIHRLLHADTGVPYAAILPINCAALPEALLESELFGYEKGAFTDAKMDKRGVFELASRGSILLDEIGDMKPGLQAKLLRVLEERAIRRVGGDREIPVDVIVMATTNRDLPAAMEAGEFRTDFFYRLNAFSVHLPPLRERKEDILVLASAFLSWFCGRYNRPRPAGFSPEAERLMLSHPWPGNVRELRNVIERIVVLENVDTILPEHLPKEMFYSPPHPPSAAPSGRLLLPEKGISLEELEKDLILQALERAKNNKTLAAKLLDVSYDSLRYQIKKFGLE